MAKPKTLGNYLMDGKVEGKKFVDQSGIEKSKGIGRRVFYEVKSVHPNPDGQTWMTIHSFHQRGSSPRLRAYQTGFNLALHLEDRLYRKRRS